MKYIILLYIVSTCIKLLSINIENVNCIFIRFLASGDSMTSISYQYLVGLTTVCNIIEETCNIIWTSLQKKVLPSHLTKDDWLNIAIDFETKWNFNHCIGAIDGKHVLLQVPYTIYYTYRI